MDVILDEKFLNVTAWYNLLILLEEDDVKSGPEVEGRNVCEKIVMIIWRSFSKE